MQKMNWIALALALVLHGPALTIEKVRSQTEMRRLRQARDDEAMEAAQDKRERRRQRNLRQQGCVK